MMVLIGYCQFVGNGRIAMGTVVSLWRVTEALGLPMEVNLGIYPRQG